MWNESRLITTVGKALKGQKFIVVSNRAPYIHQHCQGRVVCTSPAGGLTSALKPIVSAVGGAWVAQASGSADRETSSRCGRIRVPPTQPAFTLRRIWIPESLQHGYYDGLANQALWPLCHNVFRRPQFRESDWSAYKQVNHLFADAVIEETEGKPAVVFVQDYHLALLPRILKERNPNLTVAQFWHIPWPNVDSIRIFPWLDELLDGMLGNDLLGFHLREHCDNFFAAGGTAGFRDLKTIVRDVPISIDFQKQTALAQSSQVTDAMTAWRSRLGKTRRLGVAIDRSDYTKGIPERLRAIDSLLLHNPGLRGQFTFLQIAVPSRSDILEYADLDREIDVEVERINAQWATPKWQPIILQKRNLSQVEMIALHRLADFCMVTPLHDGMNLVAKEFVASRFDGDGVLILSRFAGAARELTTALQVNPFSKSSLCEAITRALNMTKPERQRRMSEARATVSAKNVYRWAGTLMEELAAITQEKTGRPPLSVKFKRQVASVA